MKVASFRGAEFFFEEVSHDGGRRLAIHNFIESDEQRIDDLGLKERRNKVSAYHVGSKQLELRQKLIDALEEKGPGSFVHPVMGSLEVSVESWSFKESRTRIGETVIEITFVQAKKGETSLEAPTEKEPPKKEADALAAATEKDMDDSMSLLDAAKAVVAAVQAVSDMIDGALEFVEKKMRQVRQAVAKIEMIAVKIRKFKAAIKRIIAFPAKLRAQVLDIMKSISSAISGTPRTPKPKLARRQPPANATTTTKTMRFAPKKEGVFANELDSMRRWLKAECIKNRLQTGEEIGIEELDEFVKNDATYNYAMAIRAYVLSKKKKKRVKKTIVTYDTNAMSFCLEQYGSIWPLLSFIEKNQLTNPMALQAGTEVIL